MDGNNLIGHERGLSLADDESRHVLVRALCALSRRTRKGILVVFDGAAPAGRERTELGPVRVLYAGGGRTARSADDRILELVDGAGRPADWTVVTSDRALASRARARGAATLPCHRFRPILREAAGAEGAGSEKPTHVDVREWAEYFGLPEAPDDPEG